MGRMWGSRDRDDPRLGRMQGWGGCGNPGIGTIQGYGGCRDGVAPRGWEAAAPELLNLRTGICKGRETPRSLCCSPSAAAPEPTVGAAPKYPGGAVGGMEAPVGLRGRPEPGSDPAQEGGIPHCLPAPSHGPGSCVPPLSPRAGAAPGGTGRVWRCPGQPQQRGQQIIDQCY